MIEKKKKRKEKKKIFIFILFFLIFFLYFFFKRPWNLLSRHLFCWVGRVTGNNNKFLLGLSDQVDPLKDEKKKLIWCIHGHDESWSICIWVFICFNNNNNIPFLYSAYHIQMASLCARGIITPALVLFVFMDMMNRSICVLALVCFVFMDMMNRSIWVLALSALVSLN